MHALTPSVPLALLLTILVSNLQSILVAYAADIACGSIATFGPAPLVGAQANTLFVTRMNTTTHTVRVHGNIDDTCDDSYTIILASESTPIPSWAELTSFKGSEVYKICASDSGYFATCSVPRLIPFFNPRQGAWKDAMLGFTPVPVWSAPAASAGASFTLTIHGGTQSYTTLIGSGYMFWLGISADRICNPPTFQYAWNQVTVTSASLSVTAPALAAGVYTLCMAVVKDDNILTDNFPLSAILGHCVHNLAIGVPNTDVLWNLQPVSGERLYYESAVTNRVRLIVENTVLTDGWTHFGIDTSADICSPYLEPSFDSSQLLPFNATHVYVETVVLRPSGNPGAGKAVLCGARGETAPWKLLSTSHYWPWVYTCPDGYGIVLTKGPTICYSCPPNALTPCNNNGNCGVFEDKTFVRSSPVCVCNPRFYTTTCSNYDLYPPAVSPPSGSYKTRLLLVRVEKAPSVDVAILQFLDGSQVTCSAPVCYLTFRTQTKFRIKSTATNGSVSLTQPWFTYELSAPSETRTLAVTESFSPTATGEASATLTQLPLPSSITLSKPGSLVESPAGARLSSTLSARLSRPPSNTAERTASSEPFLPSVSPSLSIRLASRSFETPSISDEQLPAQTSDVIELLQVAQYIASVPDREKLLRFKCSSWVCTHGLQFSCHNLTVAAIFVAPELHSCNATFLGPANSTASYSWEISVKPLPVTRENVLFFGNPRVAALYRYRTATIPYLVSGQVVLLRGCAGEGWFHDTVHLRAQQNCVVAKVSGLGFSSLMGTIRDDAVQATSEDFDLVQRTLAKAALNTGLLTTKRLSPGGLFLGVALAITAILGLFSFS